MSDNGIITTLFIAGLVVLMLSIIGFIICPFAWFIMIPFAIAGVTLLWDSIKIIRELDVD